MFKLNRYYFAALLCCVFLSTAEAATRFYLPSTGAPSISPAFGSGWTTSTSPDRIEMVTTRISSAMTAKDGTGDAGTGTHLLRQYISSQALAAQTLSGTIKGQVRTQGIDSVVGALAIRVAKCSSDGSTVTEILSITYSVNVGTASPPDAANGTLTNRRFEEGTDDFTLNLASTSIDAGDYLLIEIGYQDNSTNEGRYNQQVYGDDSASDLPEDETTTTADNPWVEFSADITFQGASGGLLLRRRR